MKIPHEGVSQISPSIKDLSIKGLTIDGLQSILP